MSEGLAWRRSQINLNWRLRESQRHLTSSSHFKLMSRISSNTSLSHKQKIFFLHETKHPPPPLFKLMNKMLGCCEQTICLRNLFEAEVCGKFICIWRQCCGLSQRITYSRDTKHTQGFSHCSIAPTLEGKGGGRRKRVTNLGRWVSVNNNLIQDLHSSEMIGGQISLWQGWCCPVLGTVYPSGVVV